MTSHSNVVIGTKLKEVLMTYQLTAATGCYDDLRIQFCN